MTSTTHSAGISARRQKSSRVSKDGGLNEINIRYESKIGFKTLPWQNSLTCLKGRDSYRPENRLTQRFYRRILVRAFTLTG